MGDSRLSPEEIRAAAEVHAELGPDYHDAVVQSFLDRLDGEVSARIDAQLGARPARKAAADPALLERRRAQLGAMVAGSVLTAVASGAAVEWSVHYPGSSPVKALALVWAVLAVLYLGYAWRLRRR
jgi:anti-sigma factor RsiW